MYSPDLIKRWNVVKTELKRRYTMLTDEDLVLRLGREGDLVGRLQQKLRRSRTDIMRMIGDVN